MKKGIISLVLAIMLVGMASGAVSTTLDASPSSVMLTDGESSSITIDYEIVSTNAYPGSYGVNLYGDYINASVSSIDYDANTTTSGSFTIYVNIPEGTTEGTYVNSVNVGGTNEDIPITVENDPDSDILVFPTKKIITLKKSEEKKQSILVTVPSAYPRTITIQSVDLNPVTETIVFDDLDLGQVAPGNSASIPLIFKTTGANAGTYQTTLTIFATDSMGQIELPDVDIELIVTEETSPINNETLNPTNSSGLQFLFNPSLDLAKDGEPIIIQLVDNETNSLTNNPEIYVNSLPLTNKSGKSFFYSFQMGKNYSLRGTSDNYDDILEKVYLESKPIELIISPETGSTNTDFSITTDSNATIYIDGANKGTSFSGKLGLGNHTILAIREGYFDEEKILDVTESIRFTTDGEFKKGVEQTIRLSKNSSWTVTYKPEEGPSETLMSGTGDIIVFEPSKYGAYTIKAGDSSFVRDIESSGTFLGIKWYLWILIVGVILVGVVAVVNRTNTTSIDSPKVGFAADINTG